MRSASLEPDALDLDQAVGVLVQHPHRVGAVARVKQRREVGEAVRRELNVQVADGAALVPAVGRSGRLALAEAGQVAEHPLGVRGDRLEDGLPVDPAEGVGADLADVAQRGQVGDLTGAVDGVERQRVGGPELVAVAGVLLPAPVDLRPVAGRQVADRPDDRDVVAGALVEGVDDRKRAVIGREQDVAHRHRHALPLVHSVSQPRRPVDSPPG